MNLMQFKVLTEKEFNEFREHYECQNFWQSSAMCHFKQLQNVKWKYSYVGIKEDDTILACTALVSTPVFLKYQLFQSLRGFMMDYTDTKLLSFFLKELKKYLHENNCLYMRMDPYFPYQSHDKEGNISDDFNNDDILNVFIKQGYRHLGFRNTHNDHFEPRWMSVLPLDNKSEEQVWKEMNIHTRQNILNTIKTGIQVKELSIDELDILYSIVEETGSRRHFSRPTLSYYKNFKQCFKDDMKVVYAYLDVEDYMERIQKEIEQLKNAILDLQKESKSKKNQQRTKEKESLLVAANKRYKEAMLLRSNHGKQLPLAAAMFVLSAYEIIYLFSGSDNKFKKFKAPYAIQQYIIQYALHNQIKRYNFYGISGNFNEKAEDYGVFTFKKGFNAEVIELLGDFEYIDRIFLYKLYNLLRGIKHMIKKLSVC